MSKAVAEAQPRPAGFWWGQSHRARLRGSRLLAVPVRTIDERAEKLAARITRSLLFGLAAYVALVAALALLGHREVRPSYLGIVVLIVAAIAMPVLARQKRQLSALTASAALRADAVESAICGYLSLIALAGLVAIAFWGVTWADPIAALCLIPLVVRQSGTPGA